MLLRYSLLLCLWLQSASVLYASEHNFNQHYQALVDDVINKPYLQPQLDFANAIERLKKQPEIAENTVSEWQAKLQKLTPKTTCQKIAFQSLENHLRRVKVRESLKRKLSKETQYSGDLSALPNGRLWYLHWLETWLMDDVTPSELQEIAFNELQVAFAQYQKMNAQARTSTAAIPAAEHQKIVAAFITREQKVKANLQTMLNLPEFDAPLTIAPSGLPESFPAPGIYDNRTQRFLYHPQNGEMHLSHFDWLYLHEGIPGHHLQFNVVSTESLCPTSAIVPIPFVSSEGWAAYVETLGKEMGLYEMPSSEAYALKWRVLRALRVLIDIGIHYQGWPDEKAKVLWQTYLPEHPEIMVREINRIKNWPAQVITYVYGKYRIEKVIEPYRNNRARALNRVLRLSNQPPLALEQLADFMPLDDNK